MKIKKRKLALGLAFIALATLLMGCSSQQKAETPVDFSNEESLTAMCDVGPDMVAASEQASYACEADSACEWKLLGGKLENQYACCPQDLMSFPGEVIDEYFGRCFIVVD